MPLLDRMLQPRPVVLTAIIAITAACVATPASSPLLATCAFACNLPAGARLATCLIGNLRRCGIARRLLSLASPASIAVLVFGPVASVRLSCMHHQESSGVAALDRDITPRSIHRGSANADHHAHMHSSTGAAGGEAPAVPQCTLTARQPHLVVEALGLLLPKVDVAFGAADCDLAMKPPKEVCILECGDAACPRIGEPVALRQRGTA